MSATDAGFDLPPGVLGVNEARFVALAIVTPSREDSKLTPYNLHVVDQWLAQHPSLQDHMVQVEVRYGLSENGETVLLYQIVDGGEELSRTNQPLCKSTYETLPSIAAHPKPEAILDMLPFMPDSRTRIPESHYSHYQLYPGQVIR